MSRIAFLSLVFFLLSSCSNRLSFVDDNGKKHHLFNNNTPNLVYKGSSLNLSNVEYSVQKVDNSTIQNKLLFGYQAWFSTPAGVYSSWKHWSSDSDVLASPVPDHASFDFWPDTSEYKIKYPIPIDNSYVLTSRGNKVFLFSNEDFDTVNTHFRWMREHHLDGVFHLRFVAPISKPNSKIALFKDKVLNNIKLAAELNGRVFAIRYNITDPITSAHSQGNVTNEFQVVTNDWKRLVDSGLTKSPSYLHHDNLPVISIYGIGFNKKMTTTSFAEQKKILEFFTSNPEPKYRAFVVAGVPTKWRESATTDYVSKFQSPEGGDAAKSTVQEPFITLYNRKYIGAIHPWHVGRFTGVSLDDFYSSVILPDSKEAHSRGLLYIPTVWPGFSWSHLEKQTNSKYHNFIPREGGNFFWRQVMLYTENEYVNALFSANFDEVDEGTAMFKQVATSLDLPNPENEKYEDPYGGFIPLNIDGFEVPNSFYLELAKYASYLLKNRNSFEITKDQMIPNIPHIKSLSFTSDTLDRCYSVNKNIQNEVTMHMNVDKHFEVYFENGIYSGGYKILGFPKDAAPDVYPTGIESLGNDNFTLTVDISNIPIGVYFIRVKTYTNYSPYVMLIISDTDTSCPTV